MSMNPVLNSRSKLEVRKVRGNLLDDASALLDQIPVILSAVEELRDMLRDKRKEYYTIEEVAEQVGRAPYTIRAWVKAGRIKATRVAGTGPRGRLLIARDQLPHLVRAGLAKQLEASTLD